jgi:hypothetical protein
MLNVGQNAMRIGHHTPHGVLSSCALFFTIAVGLQHPALAQGKLDAHYAITFARVSVGEIKTATEFSGAGYSIAVNGHARGIIKTLISGEAEVSARGAIEDGSLVPTEYNSTFKADAGTATVRMLLGHGEVKELTVAPTAAANAGGEGTEPIKGVVDPLTAVLLPAPAEAEALSAEVCRRTVAVFDGQHRYDLKFAFKRLDKEPEGKRAYGGPVLVCSFTYQPVGPHQASPLGKYLSEGREMEIALVFIAGWRVLAPVRFSVGSMLANLVIEADRFEWKPEPVISGQ